MNVRPIKTEADYDAALERIEQLWGCAHDSPEHDEFEVLVTLVEAYEDEHYPMDPPDPIEAIKFRLEQEGKDYSALIGIIGQRTRVYEVMRRARPLSLSMIRRLHEELHIPAEVLIGQSSTKKRTRAHRAVPKPKRQTSAVRKSR